MPIGDEQLSKSSVNSQWLYCFGSAHTRPDAGWIPICRRLSATPLWRGGCPRCSSCKQTTNIMTIRWEPYLYYLETIGIFNGIRVASSRGGFLVRRISVIWTGCGTGCGHSVAVRHQPYYGGFVAGLALSIWVLRLDRKASLPFALSDVHTRSHISELPRGTRRYAWIGNLGLGGIYGPLVQSDRGSAIDPRQVELSSSISQHLEGRIGAFLGRLSFPIYLMHFLVLGSLGVWFGWWSSPSTVHGDNRDGRHGSHSALARSHRSRQSWLLIAGGWQR